MEIIREVDVMADVLCSCHLSDLDEIRACSAIAGYTKQTLDNLVYFKTGYHTLDQYLEFEDNVDI
jgi:hypothetical protein